MEVIDFLSGFCCWKFKQIAKIRFGKKIIRVLNVFTLLNLEIFNSKKVKNKNVFTHEAMA
jgi:hypothetical protein